MSDYRSRSTGGISPISVMLKHTINCTSPTYSYFSRGKTGTYKVTNDYVTRNFGRIMAQGEIVNNPFYTMEQTYTTNMGSSIHRHPGTCPDIYEISHYFNFVKGSPEPLPLISGEALHSLQVQVATAAAAKVAAPDWASSVFFAELNQTVDSLRHPLKNFSKFLGSVEKKGRRRRGRKFSTLGKYLQDEWLNVRFSFRPFLYDISEGVAAIGRVLETRSDRHTARSSASLSDNQTVSSTYSDSTFRIDYDTVVSDKIKVSAGVLYDYHYDFDASFGLRPSDIPSTAWELVPYSFVADWFVNVGDYIAALTPKPGVAQLASWVVTRREITTLRSITSSSLTASAVAGGWVADQLPIGTDSVVQKSIQRECLLPVGLTIKPSAPIQVASSFRVIDALALITQRLKR